MSIDAESAGCSRFMLPIFKSASRGKNLETNISVQKGKICWRFGGRGTTLKMSGLVNLLCDRVNQITRRIFLCYFTSVLIPCVSTNLQRTIPNRFYSIYQSTTYNALYQITLQFILIAIFVKIEWICDFCKALLKIFVLSYLLEVFVIFRYTSFELNYDWAESRYVSFIVAII